MLQISLCILDQWTPKSSLTLRADARSIEYRQQDSTGKRRRRPAQNEPLRCSVFNFHRVFDRRDTDTRLSLGDALFAEVGAPLIDSLMSGGVGGLVVAVGCRGCCGGGCCGCRKTALLFGSLEQQQNQQGLVAASLQLLSNRLAQSPSHSLEYSYSYSFVAIRDGRVLDCLRGRDVPRKLWRKRNWPEDLLMELPVTQQLKLSDLFSSCANSPELEASSWHRLHLIRRRHRQAVDIGGGGGGGGGGGDRRTSSEAASTAAAAAAAAAFSAVAALLELAPVPSRSTPRLQRLLPTGAAAPPASSGAAASSEATWRRLRRALHRRTLLPTAAAGGAFDAAASCDPVMSALSCLFGGRRPTIGGCPPHHLLVCCCCSGLPSCRAGTRRLLGQAHRLMRSLSARRAVGGEEFAVSSARY